MNEQIINKINILGGNTEAVSADKSFAENWQSIRFDHHLYDKDWDVYGIDAFYELHKDVYYNDEAKFYENLLKHYFSDHELPYGQYFSETGFSRHLKKIQTIMKSLTGL